MRFVMVCIVVCGVVGIASADERERVRAHLEAALAYVEARDISRLDAAQRGKRTSAVAALRRYIARGWFPRRTHDAFAGLRPRFIDDRGVHCAVGQLIADSGAPELARAINAVHEYAYVRDIAAASPALRAWAHEHGFTVDELARIQPAYSEPPTLDNVLRRIEEHKEEIVLLCGDADPPQRKLELEVAMTEPEVLLDARTTVVVTSKSNSAFARCFAIEATNRQRWPGPHRTAAATFRTNVVIDTPSPQQLFERTMKRIGYGTHCVPRPGALPTEVTIAVDGDERGFEIDVATKPANGEVTACIEDHLHDHVAGFNRRRIHWRKRVALAPRVSTKSVEAALLRDGPSIATDCHRDDAPTKITVVTTAPQNAEQFTIDVQGAHDPFASCVAGKLHKQLRDRLAVRRAVKGKTERYFRIDAEVDAKVSFPIETPSARKQRLHELRKAAERRRDALIRKQRGW